MTQAMRVASASMGEALRAEWTKLRTVPSTGWLLVVIVVLTVAVSAGSVAVSPCSATVACFHDTTKLSLTGVELGQAIVAVLAALVVSGEYSTGMIHITLAAMPRRCTVLTAKAVIVSGLVLAAGTIAVLGSLLAGRLILPANGYTAAHGYALLSLGNGPTLRAAVGSVLYLVLIALLSLGLASALRESAVAITIVLGLLYLFPIIAAVVSNPTWQRHIEQFGPATAGLAIETTVNLAALPIQPWPGLGVLAAYAATALLAGGLLLRMRDA
jgi:ABC-2 type transport system permease protein